MATAASKSKSALYDEVMKCAEDPAYFITKYLCKSNTEIAAFVDNNKKKRQSL